ncbi:unnamed protein product, partial [marine sediment metagenome]
MELKESFLIVDDDKGACDTLCDILKKKGYRTETALTGKETIATAKA